MARGTSVLFLFAVAVVGQALTPSSFLTTLDKARLRSVFEQTYTDAASSYYSILGLKLLGGALPDAQSTCKTITGLVDAKSVESLFYASSAAKALGSCKLPTGSAQQLLTDAIKGEAAVSEIYFAYFALKNLALPVDATKVNTALQEALKQDDAPQSHGYAFLVAADLTGDVSKIFDVIEDVIAQADEVDEQYLQFEGGLYTTALVLDGAYKLGEKVKKAPTISEDKVLKFTNYFLSRKHVQQLKAAFQFLSVIKTLTENKFQVPVAVTLSSPVAVSVGSPSVQVRVTDLMGGSIGQLTVTADSAKNLGDEGVVLSKKPFTAVKGDNSLYELNFLSAKPARGFYKLVVSVSPQKADTHLIGTSGAEVEVKVTTQVSVENVEIGVADKDQTSAARNTKLQHPNKAANVLEADYHQKIIMKFQLKDKSNGQLLTTHQAFVKLTNVKTKQEIIFVTEPDSALLHKFDMDVGASGKEFGYTSGKYSMDLIVGDAVIENPFSWTLADVELTFPSDSAPTKAEQSLYSKLPNIEHLFRQPEKRPPKTVSSAFAVLVLVPLLVLLVCWIKLGANVSNFPMSVSAVGFHLCLGAIFALYYFYWVNLNMFDTLRYLGILSIPTFIFGNRLLSGIASRRKGEK